MGGGERGGTGREEMWRLGFEEKVGAAGRECTPGDSSGAAHAACLQREEEELEREGELRRVHQQPVVAAAAQRVQLALVRGGKNALKQL